MLNKSSSVDLFISPMNRSARGIVEEDDVHSTSTALPQHFHSTSTARPQHVHSTSTARPQHVHRLTIPLTLLLFTRFSTELISLSNINNVPGRITAIHAICKRFFAAAV